MTGWGLGLLEGELSLYALLIFYSSNPQVPEENIKHEETSTLNSF